MQLLVFLTFFAFLGTIGMGIVATSEGEPTLMDEPRVNKPSEPDPGANEPHINESGDALSDKIKHIINEINNMLEEEEVFPKTSKQHGALEQIHNQLTGLLTFHNQNEADLHHHEETMKQELPRSEMMQHHEQIRTHYEQIMESHKNVMAAYDELRKLQSERKTNPAEYRQMQEKYKEMKMAYDEMKNHYHEAVQNPEEMQQHP